MNKILLLLIVPIILSCNPNSDIKSESKDTNSLISNNKKVIDLNAKDFKSKYNSDNSILLDVRTPEETSVTYIDEASFINFYDEFFNEKINSMDKSKDIFVYYKGGGRSSKAAELLLENGFKNVYNLEGGIMAWEENGFNLIKGIAPVTTNEKVWNEIEFNNLINNAKSQLIVFKTKWCSPCKKLDKSLDSLNSINHSTSTTKIDFDANKSIAEKHLVNSVPTMIYFSKGKEVWREKGFKTFTELKLKLELE